MCGHQTRTRGTKSIPRCQSSKSIRRKQNEPRNPMCPACIVNMTLIAAGAGSTGGLTAFAMKIFLRADRKHQTNEIGGGQNENRNNGSENKVKRNESV